MKRLDKLILSSFIGPFILTFLVVVFILLTQFMLRYFDDIIGKGLGFAIIGELILYFSINMTTNAFPLAILLSSLMTFGNLGQHFELTAIKGAGISLLRAMQPLFVFAVFLTIFGFFNNNYIVPKANLRAFSLLYDIKQKKPSLDIKPGTFYSGIPGYTIKVNEKLPDGETIKNLIIYNHNAGSGNKEVTLADSGKMYTILSERYLVFELFDGENIQEQEPSNRRRRYAASMPSSFIRNKFEASKIVFDLEDFNLQRTRQELFKGNRMMKNTRELNADLDTMGMEMNSLKKELEFQSQRYFDYFRPEQLYAEYTSNINEAIEKRQKQQEQEARQRKLREISQLKKEAEDSVQILADSLGYSQFQEDSIKKIAFSEINQIEDSLRNESSDTKENDQGQISSAALVKKMSESNETKSNQNRVDTDVQKTKSTEKPDEKIDEIQKNESTTTPQAIKRRMNKQKESTESLKDAASISREKELSNKEEAIKAEKKKKLSARVRRKLYASDVQTLQDLDSVVESRHREKLIYTQALNKVRFVKNKVQNKKEQIRNMQKRINRFAIEKHKKLGHAITILCMFLIGAPLGAIIKRGGLGMPVLLSIAFFIFFYVINIATERWARQSIVTPFMGAWTANFILLPIGLFFLKQARNDARLFEADFYAVWIKKLKIRWKAFKNRLSQK
jgi:lipopolysaccharide export system permease protein